MAFVGLVGLYACGVRRLENEKRNAAYFLGFIVFLGFIGLLRSCCCFARFLCVLRLCWLCGLCCWWFSFPSDDCDKKKGQAVCLSSLRGLWACYIALGITKLLQAVSILKELPTTQATEKKLQL